MCDSSTSCPSFKLLLSLEKLTKVNEFWYLLLLQRLLLTTTVCSHSGLQYHMNPAWDLSFFLSKSLCQFALFLSSSYIEAVSWKSWSHPNAWCYYIEFHLPILASAPHSPFLYDSSAFMAHKGELLTQHWRPKSEVFSSDHPKYLFSFDLLTTEHRRVILQILTTVMDFTDSWVAIFKTLRSCSS